MKDVEHNKQIIKILFLKLYISIFWIEIIQK